LMMESGAVPVDGISDNECRLPMLHPTTRASRDPISVAYVITALN